MVAYEFNHDLDRIKRRFGKDTPHLGKGVPPKRALELQSEWNRGELPLLLGHPASMGHGLNLQGAGNHVCWYSMTYDYDYYDQLNRRVWRQGNDKTHVFVHHLLAKNTVDEVMLRVLNYKAKGQQALFDALEEDLDGT